ncbi:Sec-independent protein translocase subunit TatA [Cellulomonas aerilata]|uniref:Sec-independent protein translocase protein TatA n=1 Tax=Cellulomonas aerilata TaxID=515326 RepID=A0A512DAD8_9CELL|nr:Sec-independent protein translocase subunit TatA [Cellulomonas aerilata]GEO33446.1 Sec-independent protein translocase protein TatA [Cellulomonas aerilata]
MPNLRPIEILLIVLVVLLLFGARRLPELARSVGKSLKIFKSEVKDLREDDRPAPGTPVTPAALPDAERLGTTPPHGDPALNVLPTDVPDRKQV